MPSPSAAAIRTGAYLIPAPHDTRRRGANGPICSNHLSILFYRIEPQHAGKLSDILGELSRQMTDQIRDRFPESCMAALDMFKPLPLGILRAPPREANAGKFATFSFSDSGDTCAGMTEPVRRPDPRRHPPGADLAAARADGRVSQF